MNTLREGNIEHTFGAGWLASKYDEWSFYRNHFQNAFGGGSKAVDFVALDRSETLWLVELKDYRIHRREKKLALAEEVARTVRDSLAGLLAGSKWPNDNLHDAQQYIAAKKLRVVLHLEQPQRHSKMFPRNYDLAMLQQKLKQLVKVVDAHPMIVELASASRVPWSVKSVSGE